MEYYIPKIGNNVFNFIEIEIENEREIIRIQREKKVRIMVENCAEYSDEEFEEPKTVDQVVKHSANNKRYRENNRDKIKEHKQTRVTCDCGLNLQIRHLNRHKLTMRHLELMGLMN
jgi:hypothetical protein